MKKKKNKVRGVRVKKDDMMNRIAKIFENNPTQIYNYKQIASLIGVDNKVQRIQVAEYLMYFAEADYLNQMDRGRFRLKTVATVAEGVFGRKRSDDCFFTKDNEDEVIYIATRNAGNALDGDRVKVELFRRHKADKTEAKVIEIIERNKRNIVGRLQVINGIAFVINEDKKLDQDLHIPREKLSGGRDGDKVIAQITGWPARAKSPEGCILHVLGEVGNNDAEMHAILAEFGLPHTFPQDVIDQAKKLSDIITEEELRVREDFRNITTFTIDPLDAKDFDDALSIRKIDNGNWEIGVHIADVTHYVKPDTIIDKEASNRATSIYLVDRTMPMLPENLSNMACSLRPNEEKYTFSVIFEMNENAEVLSKRITKTVICSDRRFTYEEAQAIIEGHEGDFSSEINVLNKLAETLRKERFRNGAIDFDRKEVKFEIDEKGKPLGVFFKESKEANKLVEEFMLLANRSVAEYVALQGKGKRTFVYRIHEQPDQEKIDRLASSASIFGHTFAAQHTGTRLANDINRLLYTIQGKPEENYLETIALRAMQRARYTTDNLGHYGLGFTHYTHFTSPIRRYPDMMVHRLLEHYLGGGGNLPAKKYQELCEHSSAMEVIASNAERASIKYKQVEFMRDKLGQQFVGTISGVTDWGMYVEINENLCEGLVPMRDLDEDYYELQEETFSLKGKRTGKIYRLGDTVRVEIANANIERRQLDFRLV